MKRRVRAFFGKLFSPFRHQTKLIRLGNEVIDEHKKVQALHIKYREALKEAIRIQELTKKAMEEVLLKGDKPHLSKLLKSLKGDTETSERKVKQLEKKLRGREAVLNTLSAEYDKRINNFGKFWLVANVAFVGLLIYEVWYIRNVIHALNPSAGVIIDTFALNVDKDFYNVSSQLIIALAVALFIGKATKKTSATPWYDLSRFATGVCWALTGIAVCLYVLAGDTPGVLTLSVVIVSEIILLYTALKPLAFTRSTGE